VAETNLLFGILGGTAVGATVTAVSNYYIGLQQRAAEDRRRETDLTEVHRKEALERSIRARDEKKEAYELAVGRLRAARSAVHRLSRILKSERDGSTTSFSREGTAQWVATEIDTLRSTQAAVDLAGSQSVRDRLEYVIGIAEEVRDRLSSAEDYDLRLLEWTQSFEENHDSFIEMVQSELAP
jgi:hypothetical protein